MMLRNYILLSQILQKNQNTVNNIRNRYLKNLPSNYYKFKKQKNSLAGHSKATLDMVKDLPSRIESAIQSETKLGKMLKDLQSSMDSTDSSTIAHTFESEIEFRRDQAKRSIMFKLPTNTKDIMSLIQRLIGSIEKDGCLVENICLQGTTEEPHALVEFESSKSIEIILSHKTNIFKGSNVTPNSCRILYFPGSTKDYKDYDKAFFKHKIQEKALSSKFKSTFPKTNFSNQIEYFYDKNKIEDADYRTRYFVASLIDETLSNLFKNVVCFPFGSSGNKFGAKSSDLDLGILLEGYFLKDQRMDTNKHYAEDFYFLSKKNDDFNFLLFDVLSTLITNVLPRFKIIQKIEHVKVPIVKADVNLGEVLNCDISMSQVESSVLMTKLFWTFGQFDSRVAPLVFIIRYWAKLCRITTTNRPSPKFTNYQITMLVLNYLIRLKKPVLIPTDNFVTKQFVMKDKSELAEKLKSTVITDVQTLRDNTKLNNEMNLQQLLEGFFNFYSKFNFASEVVALTIKSVNKREVYASNCVFIENPFDCEQNAARNVNKNELALFKNLCLESENLLQSGQRKIDLSSFLNHIQKSTFRNVNMSNKADSIDDILIREMHDY